jgi:murein biosynthesis integral membrane protein MurJ
VTTSALVAGLVVASFLLGFLRDLLIAGRLGVGLQADILFLALVVPVFFENLLGLALRDAMIPYLQRLKGQGAALGRAACRLYHGALAYGLALSLIAAAGASWWIQALAPGWDAASRDLALPAFVVGAGLIFVQTALYCQTALLNAEGRFVLPMWRTVLYNLGGIAGLIWWPQAAVYALVGMLLGQAVLLGVQHAVVRPGLGPCSAPTSGEPPLAFLRSFLPVLLATAAQQTCVVAERVFASWLEPGSITLLSISFRIATLPLTLFALSVLAVLYPRLALTWAQGDRAAFGAVLRRLLTLALLIMIPPMLVMAAQPDAVIAVLLERGEFGPAQTAAAAPLLLAYALGLVGMALSLLWGRVLLAQQAATRFFYITLATSVLTIVLDALLYRPFGALGLAAAFAAGAWMQALWLGWEARLRHGALAPGLSWLRWVAATAAAAGGLAWLPPLTPVAALAASLGLAPLLLLAGLWLLGEREPFERRFWSAPVADTGGL